MDGLGVFDSWIRCILLLIRFYFFRPWATQVLKSDNPSKTCFCQFRFDRQRMRLAKLYNAILDADAVEEHVQDCAFGVLVVMMIALRSIDYDYGQELGWGSCGCDTVMFRSSKCMCLMHPLGQNTRNDIIAENNILIFGPPVSTVAAFDGYEIEFCMFTSLKVTEWSRLSTFCVGKGRLQLFTS